MQPPLSAMSDRLGRNADSFQSGRWRDAVQSTNGCGSFGINRTAHLIERVLLTKDTDIGITFRPRHSDVDYAWRAWT